MDALTLVLYLENPEDIPEELTGEDVIEAIREHKDTLRQLQGSYGRMIANMEALGTI